MLHYNLSCIQYEKTRILFYSSLRLYQLKLIYVSFLPVFDQLFRSIYPHYKWFLVLNFVYLVHWESYFCILLVLKLITDEHYLRNNGFCKFRFCILYYFLCNSVKNNYSDLTFSLLLELF